jgi:hypothetical protein
MVTKTDFVKTSIFTLMADYGGSMGFWLGLGVVQLCQFCSPFIKKYKCERKSTFETQLNV